MFNYNTISKTAAKNNSVLSHKNLSNTFLKKENKNSLGDISLLISRRSDSSLGGLISRTDIQTKLVVGKPDDSYEREADKMAEKVVNTPHIDSHDGIKRKEEEKKEPVRPKLQLKEEEKKEQVQSKEEEKKEGVQSKLQLKEEEKKEPVQSKEEEKKEPVQPKLCLKEEKKEKLVHAKSSGPVSHSDISSQLSSTMGSGEPLPSETRSSMESNFGVDFGGVRVHTDGNAVQMSRSLNAQAFTQGKDIYFNKDKYNPVSSNGKFLIAHELTHVVQQGGKQTHLQCQHITDTGWRYTPPKEVKRSVAEIQSIVGTTPDGIYGPNTKSFVEKYQTKLKTVGLYADTVDGKWGKNTDAAHVAFAIGPFHRRGYNCAGFAFKTYQWHNLNPTKTILGTMTKLPNSLKDTKPFYHKFWLWQVDVSVTNTVTGATTPKNRDFHIVGGQTDKKGKGPLSIMSKNGQRPLEGPKPPLQWEPKTGPAQDQDGNVVPNARWNISNTDLSCYSNDKLP